MTEQIKPTYTQIKNRYEALRQVAREVAYDGLKPVIPNKRGAAILKSDISLDGFTFNCQRELRTWEKVEARRVAWDWSVVQKKYRTHPKRFELFIWYRNQQLCGASIGIPTSSGGKLRLDFIEANPISSPLSGLIIDIVIAAGIVYAKAIGASQLRIMEPINDDVKNLYLSKTGFFYNQKGNFCYRDLT